MHSCFSVLTFATALVFETAATRSLLEDEAIPFVRINCGASEPVTVNNALWEADRNWRSSRDLRGSTAAGVSFDKNEALHKTWRWHWSGGFTYVFPLTETFGEGVYKVNLYMSETDPKRAKTGGNTFDIFFNNRLVHNDVDIWTLAGGLNKEYVLSFSRTVSFPRTDLNIYFTGGKAGSRGKCSAIEILYLGTGSPTSSPTLAPNATAPPLVSSGPYVRINCGASKETVIDGITWQADDQYWRSVRDKTGWTSAMFDKNQNLHSTWRWHWFGGFYYDIPVSAQFGEGIYQFNLYMSETDPDMAVTNGNIFNILLNDELIFMDVDIWTLAGGLNKELILSFDRFIDSSTKFMILHFTGGPKGLRGKCSAIEVIYIGVSNPPTIIPSSIPTYQPTAQPTVVPSIFPTDVPTDSTDNPTNGPTGKPSILPSTIPSQIPSFGPSSEPSNMPTNGPTTRPTSNPSVNPSQIPSNQPSVQPTHTPTVVPSILPSMIPTKLPSMRPSNNPTNDPTSSTSHPSANPSQIPSNEPSVKPTTFPTTIPSNVPSNEPSAATMDPTRNPSHMPSMSPSTEPTLPTKSPSEAPTDYPSMAPTRSPITPGEWQTLASLPVKLGEISAASVDSNGYFVFGGEKSNGADSEFVYYYDIASNTWIKKADASWFARGDHQTCQVYQSKIYCFGGSRSATAAYMRFYDPSADKWSRRKQLFAEGRSWIALSPSSGIIGSKIYITGGILEDPITQTDRTYNNTFEYDINSNTWTEVAPMPGDGRNHAGGIAYNGLFYVFGGRIGRNVPGTPLDDSFVYDPVADVWSVLAPLPEPTAGVGQAVEYDGKLFVVGGEKSNAIYDYVFAYDPVLDVWNSSFTPMLTARHGIAPVVVNGVLYVAAGGIKQGFSQSDIHESLVLSE